MKLATIPRMAAAFSGAALSTILVAGVAVAAPQDINYNCEASTVLGPVASTFAQPVDTTAPETVAPGADLSVTLTPQLNTVPTTVSGLPLIDVRNFTLTIPVPTNSTLVSASLSGGTGLNGIPQLSVVGTNVVITLDSAIAAGAEYTLPALTLNLTAGESGTIDLQLGGTSFTDPGLSFTTNVDFLGIPISAPTACFPNPNPVLASTTITP